MSESADRTQQVLQSLRRIQQQLCTALEAADGQSKFFRDEWARPAGGPAGLEGFTMFPIGDDQVPGGSARVVTLGLIALNVIVFVFELMQPSDGALQSFIQAWGVVPREYSTGHDIAPTIHAGDLDPHGLRAHDLVFLYRLVRPGIRGHDQPGGQEKPLASHRNPPPCGARAVRE